MARFLNEFSFLTYNLDCQKCHNWPQSSLKTHPLAAGYTPDMTLLTVQTVCLKIQRSYCPSNLIDTRRLNQTYGLSNGLERKH